MTWATPTLAALVAAIAIPALVILYFLKIRRIPREVSSTLLWNKAIQDLQANAG
jgi:Aerotolerance regulator N-terminal